MNFPHLQQNITLPVGSITAFAGKIEVDNTKAEFRSPVEEMGWMVCDGRQLETYKYPELFAVLGNLYGGNLSSGDKSYFNLPDLRGMFLRGVGSDEASTESRTQAAGGDKNGVGSTQDFAVQKHVHVYKSPIGGTVLLGSSAPAPVNDSINQKDTTETPTESAVLGNVKVSNFETRPTNVFINYLIKYRY